MSYCRRSNSDIYVFTIPDGRLMCQCCPLGEDYLSRPLMMAWHVWRHRWRGHQVKPGVIRSILLDWLFEDFPRHEVWS